MERLITLLAFLVLAHPALAGAWLREKGGGFSSVAANTTLARDFGENSYLEYGVRDDLTLGAEVSFLSLSNGIQSGFATMFLRRPLGRQDRRSVWAYELGMGVSWTGDLIKPHLQTGISWGRGYSVKTINGWMAVDTSVIWDVYDADHLIKLDSTVGMNFNSRFSGMVQLYAAGTKDDFATSIAPSVLIRPLKNRPNIRLQIGAETQIGNPANSGVKFSFWREF